MECRLKEGDVMKYNAATDKWEKFHAVLFSDSNFRWYEKLGAINPLRWCNGSYKLKGSILLLEVMPYICIGQMTERMPVKPPDLPNGYAVDHLVGIGMDLDAETVHWILFSSDEEIESWITEIIKTLPTVPTFVNQPQQRPQSAQKSETTPISDDEPSKVGGDAPPPYDNQRQGGNDGSCQTRPRGSTKINIDQGGDIRGRGRSFTASALGKGLLGFGSAILAGSLASYGFGSMWESDNVRELGYHSDSDTDGEADYLDLGGPTQSQQAISVIGNDDDHCRTGDADCFELEHHIAHSDGCVTLERSVELEYRVADSVGCSGGFSNGDFGGGDYSGGDFGGSDCGGD